MDNALLHASGHSPEDKIEERINSTLSHARLYLSESDDERDNKSSAANKLYIYPVVVDILALRYQPSLSLYRILLM